MMLLLLSTLAAAALVAIFFLPWLLRYCGSIVGNHVRSQSETRRAMLMERVDAQVTQKQNKDKTPGNRPIDSADSEWEGIVAFLHPFCNAGGGGERVLWAAIRATQQRYPNANCVVYTGDHDVDKQAILENVKNRFNIPLYAPRITFLYLSTRHFLLASRWPYFTLLGQSVGSLIVAWDAFHLITPDIFIDTMGYAFALALCNFLFPDVPTAAYVHYPTISTDMLDSLDDQRGRGVNAGLGHGWKGTIKRNYWSLFAKLYSWVGGEIDVVMTNSTWTSNHIKSLWAPTRNKRKWTRDISVVFPPVAVEELEQAIDITEESEKSRTKDLLYIAQFRPEKDHHNIIIAFATLLKSHPEYATPSGPKLILIGSVRDEKDKMLVYKLRVLAQEHHVSDHVDFVINAKWAQILDALRTSSVGVNGMWNEHFGIGVVEYQAAGLISVVDDSGGPKIDIVVPVDGQPTGFHARSANDFATSFHRALSLSPEETLDMRRRARKSSKRFSEEVFRDSWDIAMDKLIRLQKTKVSERASLGI